MGGQSPTKLRSQLWFDDPAEPGMTALYLERYLNYGLTRGELQSGKPIIGIAQTGSDLVPCNRHHLELASRVKDGIREAGGVPMEFPVHPLQETGKRPTAALDRNLAFLGLVEVLHGYPLDGVVLTTGCDKTTPACLMAAAAVDIPAIVLSGGPMLDGYYDGKLVGSGTVVWHARKLLAAGEIDYAGFMDMVAASAPSVGHCNTMGTASSMNVLAEALGMSLPGCAAIPAPYRERGQMAHATGKRIVEMIGEDLKPSRIMTREAFENAIVVASAIGASSNCPVHLIAIARHMGVELSLDDWQEIGHDVPLIVNMQPAGEHLGEGFFRAGGVPGVIYELIQAGRIRAGALTVSGRTIADNCADAGPSDRDVIRTVADPLLERAGYVVLGGNLFDAAVMKTSVISKAFRDRYLSEPGDENAFEGRADRLRRPGGLPPPHQRCVPRYRRAQHPVHPQLRAGRLSGVGGSGQHAAPRRPHQARHHRTPLRRRRPPERHLGQPFDPQRLAGGGGGGRSRLSANRRPGARRPGKAAGQRVDPGRRVGAAQGVPAACRTRQPDAVAGDLPDVRRPARHRRLPGAGDALPQHHRATGQPEAFPLRRPH